MLLAALVLAWAGWRSRGTPARHEGIGAASRALGALTGDLDLAALAGVVRDFVADQYGVPAPQQTTEEVRALLPAGDGTRIADLLAACDRAKFAGHQPDAADVRRAIETATEIVGAARSPAS